MMDRARELGRALGQTDEYRALERARGRLEEEEELRALLERLAELEGEIGKGLQRGEEPGEKERAEYEEAFSTLQGHAGYQSFVAAQANFEKLMSRVNEEIGKGIEAGSRSRIIIPE